MTNRNLSRRERALLAGSAILCGLMMAAPATAAPTRAGVDINNQASASFDQGGTTVTVQSNNVVVKVDELIDTTVQWTDPADVATTNGATGVALRYVVTNTGNGSEGFKLSFVNTVTGDQFDPSVVRLLIDDGDGVVGPGDTVYTPGTNDPVLEPGASTTILVVTNTPTGLADGDRGGVQLIATALTGAAATTRTPGSVAGTGDNGSTAIFGLSGGTANATGYEKVSAATVALAKSAVVTDPFGGTSPVPGATITYTLTATTTGSGNLPNLRIEDAIPALTTYVPGSITLAGTALTDAADADAGSRTATGILVNLGTVAGGQTRTITFQVKIN